MATQQKRRAPRASFVVTVTVAASALTFAALPGCGSVSDGSCPESTPSSGDDCDVDGQVCSYGNDQCGNGSKRTCEDGEWVVSDEPITYCNPPPPTPQPVPCPAELPDQGGLCGPQLEPSCSYPVDTGCGPIDAQAQCVDGTWQVAIPTCNPPPPDYCYTLATEADCAANASFCRWLVPGCADPASPPPALAQAGCHPSFDCVSSDECPVGTTCSEVVTDPCYNQGCNACGLVSNLCVAP